MENKLEKLQNNFKSKTASKIKEVIGDDMISTISNMNPRSLLNTYKTTNYKEVFIYVLICVDIKQYKELCLDLPSTDSIQVLEWIYDFGINSKITKKLYNEAYDYTIEKHQESLENYLTTVLVILEKYSLSEVPKHIANCNRYKILINGLNENILKKRLELYIESAATKDYKRLCYLIKFYRGEETLSKIKSSL